MHIDLWDPGTDLSKNSSGRHLLNAMCDLTQVIISTITTETHAEQEKSFSIKVSRDVWHVSL